MMYKSLFMPEVQRLLKPIAIEDANPFDAGEKTLIPAIVIKIHPVCFHLHIVIFLNKSKSQNKYIISREAKYTCLFNAKKNPTLHFRHKCTFGR